MAQRKPPNISFESWVDRQIRDATDRGEFDDLPGRGKPIADLDRPRDELWWVRQKMHRENLSYLPPTLALRKEAEDVRATVSRARSEAEVRRVVGAINDKIRAAHRMPPSGPPLNLMPYDVEAVVGDWYAKRADGCRDRGELEPAQLAPSEQVAEGDPARGQPPGGQGRPPRRGWRLRPGRNY